MGSRKSSQKAERKQKWKRQPPPRPSTVEDFSAIAHRFLPEEDAAYWISLLRPAVRLRHAGDGDATVGYLAGDPVLPADAPWPLSEFDEPLTHLMTLDLSKLPDIGLGLPEAGLLQFFCFDDEGRDGTVHFIPPDVPTVLRPSPADLSVFDRVPLTAAVETTAPRPEHAYLWDFVEGGDDEFPGTGEFDTPQWREAIGDTIPSDYHLIGGYGIDVQGPADFAPSATPVLVRTESGIEPETKLPVLLAQIDTDGDARIGWGDMGISHWYIDREDLAARRFERVTMTWTCH